MQLFGSVVESEGTEFVDFLCKDFILEMKMR
jgi:hypothetical protein